jgi:hypothetical protein
VHSGPTATDRREDGAIDWHTAAVDKRITFARIFPLERLPDQERLDRAAHIY